jgi:hypothetical protein
VSIAVGALSRLEISPEKDKAIGTAIAAKEADLFVEELAPKGGKTRLLLVGQNPGTYYIVLWSAGEIESTLVEVTVTGVVKPVPPPLTGKIKAYIVTESTDKNINYTKLLTDNFGKYDILLIDPDVKDPSTNATPLTFKPFVDKAKGKKDQMYLIDTGNGALVWEGSAPQSSADFAGIVGKFAR